MAAGNVGMLSVSDTALSTCRIQEYKYYKQHYDVCTITMPNSHRRKWRLGELKTCPKTYKQSVAELGSDPRQSGFSFCSDDGSAMLCYVIARASENHSSV